MATMANWLFPTVFLAILATGLAMMCYQCDSNEDVNCPSNRGFDWRINSMIDCNSLEAHTPGKFCMKITQQSPGWRGWKKVTRRCGTRSDTGLAFGCRWQYEENGVWRETCYCQDKDGCNSAPSRSFSLFALMTSLLAVYVIRTLH